jgi:type IV secretory pathway TraG/TraD family ATPase VirD4
LLSSLLHGWNGLALAYGAVQVPMLAGLVRSKAEFHKYLQSPIVAVPLTAAVALGASAFGGEGILQLACATAFSAALGYVGGRGLGQATPPNGRHQRGALIEERAESRNAPLDTGHALSLAGIRVPAQDESKHFKIIGATGTGKSTAISEILDQALARGDRAVIADPDGGYLQRFHDGERGDIVLNPFESRSLKWNLFAEIHASYDVEQLARSLIPDQEAQDRSWRGYARTFFTAVTRRVHEAGVKDVGELYRLLVVADAAELRTLLRGTPAQPFLEEHNSRMFDSIRSVASAAVGALEHVAAQSAPDFSIRQWVSQAPKGVLFMPYKANQIAAMHSTISAWMRLAIFETMNRDVEPEGSKEHGSRLWFIVDELDALGQIDGLKDALARLRKFDGRCVLGFQSIAQVSSTYGAGDAHTIVENCGNTLLLRCSASEGGGTARFASQLIGEREVLRTTVSRSRRATEFFGSTTHGQHLAVEQAVLPSQVEQLPDLAGFLKNASDPTWRRVRLEARTEWHTRKQGTSNTPQAARMGRGIADE